MSLITLRNIQLGFGGPLLLERVNLTIESGERICLLGRNGEGKSTLMKLLTGELQPDDGELTVRQGAQVARLTQEVPAGLEGSIFDVVAQGVGELAGLVQTYHHIISLPPEEHGTDWLQRLEQVQHDLEAVDGWQVEQRVERVISRLSLDPEQAFAALSGGMKRRVMLAQALVMEPDLLLLDEPTNHLDIDSIAWLEEFLLSYGGSLLFVTHDRSFLRRIATRIVELDRGQVTDWPGDYANFLRRKEERLHAESQERAGFDKKLAAEEVWIRLGIKARRTRNEGRVRALEKMRRERLERREQAGRANMALHTAERSGKLVVEAEKITYAWETSPVIKDLSCTIMRGDRIGIIGPNGSGKSTLLKLLLGELSPDSGTISLGTKLEVAYFDQLRSTLDEAATVRDSVADGSDHIEVNGSKKHVIGYLQDFLFPPERANQPVSALSGGERNRLLLAKLFTRPCNVLVMDEPTNDLDMETLELLEELLLEYQGTLLLVSHDREFLNNVVTSTLVFEGGGRVAEYVGGYDDWMRQRKLKMVDGVAVKKVEQKKSAVKAKKLSYKEQQELEQLPQKIERLDLDLVKLQQRMADPELYQQGGEEIATLKDQLAELEMELEQSYSRWEELDVY